VRLPISILRDGANIVTWLENGRRGSLVLLDAQGGAVNEGNDA